MDAAFFHAIDIAVFIIANLTNLLLAVMFLFRARGRPQVGNGFGWGAVVLGIPLLAAVILNTLGARPWWTVILPALMVAYDVAEFLLDFLLKFDFRHSRWLGPYLALYYLTLMGMIGYSFTVAKSFGFITLTTYFISRLLRHLPNPGAGCTATSKESERHATFPQFR